MIGMTHMAKIYSIWILEVKIYKHLRIYCLILFYLKKIYFCLLKKIRKMSWRMSLISALRRWRQDGRVEH